MLTENRSPVVRTLFILEDRVPIASSCTGDIFYPTTAGGTNGGTDDIQVRIETSRITKTCTGRSPSEAHLCGLFPKVKQWTGVCARLSLSSLISDYQAIKLSAILGSEDPNL